jgi:hypothetical protein
VLLLDRKNQAFVDGLSSRTAEQQRTIGKIITVLLTSLLFGLVMTKLHDEDAHLARRLRRTGRQTQALVLGKRTTSSGDGRDFCYIKYEFQEAQPFNAKAGRRVFENEDMVSDSVYDGTSKGQVITVLYDPHDPSVSIMETAMHSPFYPTWLVWIWWIGSVLILGWLFWGLWVERRIASKGILVKGTITEVKAQSQNDPVEVRYAFYSPAGKRIEAVVRKPASDTNFFQVFPILGENDFVAVLYLADGAFVVL